MTINNSRELQLTPFKLIHTYIHLVDTKGVESLFEAEMNRFFNFIQKNKQLTENEYAFAIFDELFTSTNFYEGVSAAYAICTEFTKHANLIVMLTTHYKQLTDLEFNNKLKNGPNKFSNYKVTVDQLNNGRIDFNYLIQRGISEQYIALDLLQLKGFDPEIINNAFSYMKQLHNISN